MSQYIQVALLNQLQNKQLTISMALTKLTYSTTETVGTISIDSIVSGYHSITIMYDNKKKKSIFTTIIMSALCIPLDDTCDIL